MTIVIIVVATIIIVTIGVWFFSKGHTFPGRRRSRVQEASFAKALYYLSDDEDELALEEFKKIALKGNCSPDVYIIMSTIYRKKGQLLKAIHLCEGLMVQNSMDRQSKLIVLRELVKCYRAAGTMNRAAEWADKVQENKYEPDVMLIKADILSSKGDHESAIKKLKRYEKITGKSCKKEISLEFLRMAEIQPDYSRRLRLLKNAIRFDGRNRSAYFAMADLYFEGGKKDQGMHEISTIIDYNYIKTKSDMKRVEEAYYKYSTLDALHAKMLAKVADGSDYPDAYLFLSDYHIKKGERQEAAKILEDYILQHGARAVILRAFARVTENQVLARSVRLENLYKCSVCGTEYSNYVENCAKCGGMESLHYL